MKLIRPLALMIIILLVEYPQARTFAQQVIAPTTNKMAERSSHVKAVMKGDLLQRNRQLVQPEQFRRAILRYLEQELAGKVREVHVSLIEPQEALAVPMGRLDFAVLPSVLDEGLGRRLFHIQLTVNGKPVETVEVTSDVAGFLDVVVPTRFIKTDEVIEADDVALSRVKLLDLKQQFVTDMDEVVGKSAARPLQAQAPVRLVSVKKPYAVRKGDRVTIEARGGGLSIQTVGTTKSGGQVGQIVTVTNVDSGKEIRAKVIGPGVVQVEF